MKFDLTNQELELLKSKNIQLDLDCDYSDDEALDLLDHVRDVEISYSQSTTNSGRQLYQKYGSLADKMQAQIPEY